jgi:CO/xanthine dehydrogenase Mo-binding subunit
MIGKSIIRKEDAQLPGMLHVAFVRSPYAHANVPTLHRDRAITVPGAVAVGNSHDWPELAVPMPDLLEPGTLRNPYCDLDKAAPMRVPR